MPDEPTAPKPLLDGGFGPVDAKTAAMIRDNIIGFETERKEAGGYSVVLLLMDSKGKVIRRVMRLETEGGFESPDAAIHMMRLTVRGIVGSVERREGNALQDSTWVRINAYAGGERRRRKSKLS